ncbi:MAG: hypothetical protein GOP50_03655 [Candidatus Heimdallarchaeota archaeon]|nr:hypothetical protein [Candidatus Heimdallarchaeota archaeon]
MKIERKLILLIIISLEVVALVGSSAFVIYSKTNNVQAQETDFTVIISKDQYYDKNNITETNGYIRWVDLNSGGGYLTIYGNVPAMQLIAFWDGIGNLTEGVDFTLYDDRIRIYPRTIELYYKIEVYSEPDYFIDTNFIVIFDTFWAQFSYLTPEGEERYAPVTYHNKQILPKGAGLVSFAPTDKAVIVKEGERFGITWDYEERAMDPFHDPLTYEITYNYDPIYLQFTEQMYQNQSQEQELEQIESLLDLLQIYFRLIAFLAVVVSIMASLYGYLRAKRKFKSRLNEARSLPKKMLRDIEGEQDPRKRVSALFNVFFILLLISQTMHINDQTTDDVNYQTITNNKMVTMEGAEPILNQDEVMDYETIVDLDADGIAFETVKFDIGFLIDNYSIWIDTSEVLEFSAYNEFGTPVSYQQFSDRYLIRNVQGYIHYEIVRPYVYYNNSNILVYLDYFWLLFINPDLQNDTTLDYNYSKANIDYTVIMPEDSIVYSASPEDYLTLDGEGKLEKTPEGRTKIRFIHPNREIDPYHDLFSAQITYSFIDVIDAIEDLSARFEHFRVETELTEEQKNSLMNNLIFLSLLGLIAPILAFLLTYFIVRRRMIKKIQEEEQKYEMLVSVEEIQIDAIKRSREIDVSKEPWKAMLGEYWELLGYLSRAVPVNLLAVNEDLQEKTIRKYIPSFLISETLEILSVGRGISNSMLNEEQVYYTKPQSRDYVESVMSLIQKFEKWRKEQK